MTEAVEVAMIMAVPPTLVAVSGIMVVLSRIKAVHVQINSRMDELLRTTGTAEHARGQAEGIASERAVKP